MKETKQNTTSSEAALSFLSGLSPEKRQEMQQEVNIFVVWYGKEKPIDRLAVNEVASYGEWVIASHADASKRLAPVRAFLTYAKKEGFIRTGLASHLGTRKASSKTNATPTNQKQTERELITREVYDRMKAELESLKEERPIIAEEIRKAAADKDFRENAPLEAAKERQGHIEGQIQQLEVTLSAAIVQEDNGEENTTQRASLNSKVIVYDLIASEEITYTLVTPREIAPLEGRISIQSPIGKGLLNCQKGDEVEVEAPSGILRYRIQDIVT